MTPRRLLALLLLYALLACARTPDDRVTQEQWGTPSLSPRYQKGSAEQRLAFDHYRRHLVRLNGNSTTGLPGDVTWDEAIARGSAMRLRERDAVRMLAKAIGNPRVRVAEAVYVGRSGTLCGWIRSPQPAPGRDRPFLVLPSDEVIVAPSAEEFAADRERAVAAWREVGSSLDQCELDTSLYRTVAAVNETVQERMADMKAIERAQAAGERGDRNALREIIEQQSDRLLEWYFNGFRNAGLRITPEIEGILVLASEQQHKPATWPLMLPSWPRCTARYATPAMRAALLDRAKQSPEGSGVAQFLCGGADVDAEVLELLASLESPPALSTLVRYLRIRQPPGTVRALVAKYPTLARDRDLAGVAAGVHVTLLAIGTGEALAAHRAQLASLTARRDEFASVEAGQLLDALTQTAYAGRVDRSALLALWAAFPQREPRLAFGRWASFHDIVEAVPYLLRSLEDTGDATFASIVLRIGGPADWKRVDAWSRNTDAARSFDPTLRKAIDAALVDPTRTQAEQAKRRQEAAWHAAMRDDILEEEVARHDKVTDPAGYLAWQRARLARHEAASREFADLPAATELARRTASEYAELAEYARWKARDPKSAIALWQIVMRESHKEPSPIGLDPFEFAIADTMRFDMGDPRGAAARLRAMRERMVPSAAGALGPWIDAEVAFLQDGSIAQAPDAMCILPAFFLQGGGFPGIRDVVVREIVDPFGERDPARLAESLDSLTPSLFHLYASFHRWPVFGTPERVVRFGRRHDPSGLTLSCAMRLVQAFAHLHAELTDGTTRQRNLPQWSDAEFALMSQAAMLVVRPPPAMPAANPALASPQGTWNTFVAALRRGDAAAARACLGAEARAKMEPLFATRSKEELRAIAESFTRFELSSGGESVREAYVTRNGRSGIVSFVKQGKEWRIADL